MLVISDKVTWKRVKKGAIIVDLNSGNYFTLNETATRIWELLAEGKSLDEVQLSISGEFEGGTKEKVMADIQKQHDFFLTEGLFIKK